MTTHQDCLYATNEILLFKLSSNPQTLH